MSKSEYELAVRLLILDRGASEAEDARDRSAATPMPQLSDEQCAAMDEMGDIA